MSSVAKSARRTLQALVWIIVILFALLTFGVATDARNATATPGLGLDLKGGKLIILEAVATNGATIDESDMKQAVSIIRKRVDATGTSEAEIATEGDLRIRVSLPGDPDDATLDLVRKSAQLQFRPVLVQAQTGSITTTIPTTNPTPTPDTVSPTQLPGAPASVAPTTSASTVAPTPTASAVGIDTASPVHEVANVETAAGVQDATPTPTPSASAEPSASPSPALSDTPATTPTDASDLAWITPKVQAEFDALDCTLKENQGGGSTGDPNAAFAACDTDGLYKYILGPVEMDGKDVSTASSGPNITQAGTQDGFAVFLKLTGSGGKKFTETTTRLYELNKAGAAPRDEFAMVLDGAVISAPRVGNGPITGGEASITGNFTQSSAQLLANQLKFGALPMTLIVLDEQFISSTTGDSSLRHGMIAGLIGLILVVIYTMFQYRALAAVTIGSLIVAGVLTYEVITLLSWGMNYRLTLAGVTGLIVAIGITADSFIIYFERVKDELRSGRSLAAAVEHGWKRARRTVIASDAVSFLAALVLYTLAVGSVRGFAFTLGLTTLVDLMVVFMFTHPTLALLARTKFFGDGHRFSGLDPRQLGRDAIYKGKGRAPVTDGDGKPALTLAERKAQKARAAADAGEKE